MKVRMHTKVYSWSKEKDIYVQTGDLPEAENGVVIYTWTVDIPIPSGIVDLGMVGATTDDS